MTEEDKFAELDRQLRLVETGESVGVFCPWCTKMATPDLDDCCPMFTEAKERRGREQFKSIVDQYTDCERGISNNIRCPYCLRHNYTAPETPRHPSEWKRPNVSPFCCRLFELAAAAIVQRMDKADKMQDLVDQKKRIEDRMVN